MKQLMSLVLCIACVGTLRAQAPAPANAPSAAPATAPAAAPNGVEEPAPAAAAVDPYRGTLGQGLDELRALAEKGDTQQALAIADQLLAPSRFAHWRERALASEGWHKQLVETADPLLDWLGVNSVPPEHRAAVHYARAVVLSQSGDRGASEQAFERARELAGVGALRLDSIYNLGVAALTEGEEFRAQIPELQAAAGAPQASAPVPPTAPPLPGVAGANAAAPPPDPLQLARAAYLKAREHFVERLRSQWQDDDTQANVELVQRRLKELAQLEKQREEEKQKQEQEQKDQEQQKQDQKQQQDQGKPDDSQKDKDASQDQKDQQDQQQPDADKQPEEQKPEEPKDKTQEQKDKEAQQKEQQKKEAAQGEPKEELLTKEEMMRLLDILKQREEQGQRLLEQLHRTRRAKVKKDW